MRIARSRMRTEDRKSDPIERSIEVQPLAPIQHPSNRITDEFTGSFFRNIIQVGIHLAVDHRHPLAVFVEDHLEPLELYRHLFPLFKAFD